MYCQLVKNETKQIKFISNSVPPNVYSSLYHKKFFCMNFHLVIFIFYYFISFIISFDAVYVIVMFVFLHIQILHMPG